MKKSFYLLILFCLLFLGSCSVDDINKEAIHISLDDEKIVATPCEENPYYDVVAKSSSDYNYIYVYITINDISKNIDFINVYINNNLIKDNIKIEDNKITIKLDDPNWSEFI